MAILVTGGTGYIGSHTCVALLQAGYDIVVMDNFYNSKPYVVERMQKITGKSFVFYEADCCNEDALRTIFKEHHIEAAVHFAGYKAVGESVSVPLKYYQNNIMSTLALCKVMEEFSCFNLVFSSSATVYGSPETVPIKEDFPLSTTNPYGTTKLFIERILTDLHVANNRWSIALLRYFNPIGAHKSGLLGESPNDIPNNLMPYINKVAAKELPHLNVFGNDYDTHDGTGVRDYIHVIDLAKGHIQAIAAIMKTSGVEAYNLGTGCGYSVLDIVHTFEKANDMKIPYLITARRPGDIATCYADGSKAKEVLHFSCEYGIEDMCKDAWHFIEEENKRKDV